jgi:hypothetical protein
LSLPECRGREKKDEKKSKNRNAEIYRWRECDASDIRLFVWEDRSRQKCLHVSVWSAELLLDATKYNWLILMGDSVSFECAVSQIGLHI